MDAFSAFFRLLSPARRRQFVLTLLLMLAGAVAEMVTIGAALPFLALVADPRSALVPPRLLDLLEAMGGSPVVARKSTRLNSSHGYISYAVFCLKKKISPF